MMSIALAFAALVAGAATVASPDRVSAVGLQYRVDGSGPDVVLIHGFQTDLREWDDVAAGLAATHRVTRYDVRGHGRSTIPPSLPPSMRLTDRRSRPSRSWAGAGRTRCR